MAASEWFYIKPGAAGDSTEGPLSHVAFLQLCREGKVLATSLVSHRVETGGKWIAAAKHAALAAAIEERQINSQLARDFRRDQVRWFLRDHIGWFAGGGSAIVCFLIGIGVFWWRAANQPVPFGTYTNPRNADLCAAEDTYFAAVEKCRDLRAAYEVDATRHATSAKELIGMYLKGMRQRTPEPEWITAAGVYKIAAAMETVDINALSAWCKASDELSLAKGEAFRLWTSARQLGSRQLAPSIDAIPPPSLFVSNEPDFPKQLVPHKLRIAASDAMVKDMPDVVVWKILSSNAIQPIQAGEFHRNNFGTLGNQLVFQVLGPRRVLVNLGYDGIACIEDVDTKDMLDGRGYDFKDTAFWIRYDSYTTASGATNTVPFLRPFHRDILVEALLQIGKDQDAMTHAAQSSDNTNVAP